MGLDESALKSIRDAGNQYARKSHKKWESNVVVDGAPGSTHMLSGCEAIARGALEAGIALATSYPGSPTTYVFENLANAAAIRNDFHAEWSTNEKCGFEAALGAAMCGMRALTVFKNNGMNWIIDPLLCSYTMRPPGGLVVCVGDDPGANTSSSETDARFLAVAAEIPVLEPASYQECKDFTILAFRLSEQVRVPVLLRTVRQFLYGRGPVMLGEIDDEPRKRNPAFEKSPLLWAAEMGPRWENTVLQRHTRFHHETVPLMRRAVEDHTYYSLKRAGRDELALIATGMGYAAAVEALQHLGLDAEVTLLKLGAVHPLPAAPVRELLESVSRVLIVEETEPFVETQVRDMTADLDKHAKVLGKKTGHIPATDELSRDVVARALGELTGWPVPIGTDPDRWAETYPLVSEQLSKRPQGMFCPGCPEMAMMYCAARVGRKLFGKKVVGHGDIGCYERGIYPPWNAIQTIVCMGAGLGLAHGMYHAKIADKMIVHLGDGTFFHAALPEVMNALYNKSDMTILIYDNRCVGATGQQMHPGAFGLTATHEQTSEIDIVAVAKALGVPHIETCDPFDVKETLNTIERAMQFKGVSMVVGTRTCSVLAERQLGGRGAARLQKYEVVEDACPKCTDGGCGVCFVALGCPAIMWDGVHLKIDPAWCVGCGVCSQICPRDAIRPVGMEEVSVP
ncbi:MAG: thiamine pyrophosphate-dependent enzyme [Candidatus Methylomirabilia bacterium]